jgi:hypothetical protein
MTIDTPSVFCWALAALLFWDALHNDKISTWFWLGLVVGAGFLAKFTNGVQLICIGFFLLWSKEHRHLLFSPKIFVMSAAFLLASVPIFWWNMETGWVHLTALHSRSGVTDSFHIRPDQFFRFVGEQFGAISPFLMIGIVIAAIALLITRHGDVRVRFLLSQYLPLYALFAFFALNKAGQPNWTVPVLVTGIIFTVVYWRELAARNQACRYLVAGAYIISLAGVVILHLLAFLPVPPQYTKYNPIHRAQGWPDFAAHVQKARLQNHADLLLGSDYSLASLMAFYLPDQPATYMAPEPYGSSQFTLWPGYKVSQETRALYVTWDPEDPPQTLKNQFSNIRLIDDFMTMEHGRPVKRACIYLCTVN